MNCYLEHDITLESFSRIDKEIGDHDFSPDRYQIIRRVIHTTADFEYAKLLTFQHAPIAAAATALQAGCSIVTDVEMVAAGIRTVVTRTWQLPVMVALHQAPGQALAQGPLQPDWKTQNVKGHNQYSTRSAAGMANCKLDLTGAIVVIGNAPTALMQLCSMIQSKECQPALVVGAPVGFVNVVEAKQALAALSVPQIVVEGRKGGSPVAAAILNAVMIAAWTHGV